MDIEGCNYAVPKDCSLNGNCLAGPLIYRYNVSAEGVPTKTYGGQAKVFKTRYYKHKNALEHEDSPAATSLSRYVWSLEKQGKTPKLSWSKVCLAPFFTSGSRKCMFDR